MTDTQGAILPALPYHQSRPLRPSLATAMTCGYSDVAWRVRHRHRLVVLAATPSTAAVFRCDLSCALWPGTAGQDLVPAVVGRLWVEALLIVWGDELSLPFWTQWSPAKINVQNRLFARLNFTSAEQTRELSRQFSLNCTNMYPHACTHSTLHSTPIKPKIRPHKCGYIIQT